MVVKTKPPKKFEAPKKKKKKKRVSIVQKGLINVEKNTIQIAFRKRPKVKRN
jgi:hypothetical protein